MHILGVLIFRFLIFRFCIQKDQIAVIRRIQELRTEPSQNQSRKLRGHDNIYRIRAGTYRILYSIEHQHVTIIILKVGHRRDVYR